MQFIDKAKIYIEAGKGGDGTVAFRREAHVPKGGPAGGDGGKGGSIIFEATTSLSTLLDLKYKRVYKARPGGNGMAKKMHGADASDLVIKVPVGTVITNEETGKIMADLTEDRQRVVLVEEEMRVLQLLEILHHKFVKEENREKNLMFAVSLNY